MDMIVDIINSIDAFVWGPPMLVLLLLGVPKISLYYKIDTLRHYGEPVYDRSALKVMAYNVRMFYGDDGRSTVDSLAAFVNRYDPDILCIEEFSDLARGATMRFDSLIAPGYRRAVYSRDGEGTAGVALAVYSKLRILASGAVDCVNDVDTTRATAVWADLRLDRDTVRVFCNHLRSTHIKSSDSDYLMNYRFLTDTASHEKLHSILSRLRYNSISRSHQAVAADRGHTPRTYRVRRFQRYAPVLHLPPHVARIAGCFPREGTGILAYLSGILQYVPHRLRAGFRRFRGAFVRGAVRRVFGSPPRFRPAQIQFATTMILDSLENRARYYALNPRLEKAFDYLLSTDLGALPAGRHAIDGDDVFINVMDVDLKRPADAKLEIHDRYLDIQVLVRGEREAFGWSQRDRVTRPLGAFDVQKDIRFYDDVPQTYYEVTPGQFTLLFPEDAHAPMVGEGTIRKVIVKVRV